MTKKTGSHKVVKPTFEAVLNAQEQLRVKLNELINENRCLRDKEERSEFTRLLAHSTLGLGVNEKIELESRYGLYIRNDLEITARWVADQTSDKIYVPIFLSAYDVRDQNHEPNFKISSVWKALQRGLYSVFPVALDRAVGMSKEKEDTAQSKGYQIDSHE